MSNLFARFKEYEDWLVDQNVKVKGKNRTEAEKAEREAQDNAEHENWWMGDDVGSNNSGYYVLQVGRDQSDYVYVVKCCLF